MYKIIFTLLLVSYNLCLAQNRTIGLEYSFEVQIPNELMREAIMKSLEGQISHSYKIIYADKGIIRWIEKNNNYCVSFVYQNDKNKLTIFDSSGILKITDGSFNEPFIIEDSTATNFIKFKTKSGNYTYTWSEELSNISLHYENLGEHSFNKYLKLAKTLPQSILFEMGFLNFYMELQNQFEIKSSDRKIIDKVIENPNNDNVKSLILYLRDL